MNLNFLRNFNLFFYFSFLFFSCGGKNKNNNLYRPGLEETENDEKDLQDNTKNDPIILYFPGIKEKVSDSNRYIIESGFGNKFDAKKLIPENEKNENSSQLLVFPRNGIYPNDKKIDDSKIKSTKDQAQDIFDKNKDDFKKLFEKAITENRNVVFEGYSQGGLVLIELLNLMNKDTEFKKLIEELNSKGLLKVITIASPINGYQGGQITEENILSLKEQLENLEKLLFEKLKDKDFCEKIKGKVENNDKYFKEKLSLTGELYSIINIFIECFKLNPLTYENLEVFKSIFYLQVVKEQIDAIPNEELKKEFEKLKKENKSSFSLLADVCEKRNKEFKEIGIQEEDILSITTEIPASSFTIDTIKEGFLNKNNGINIEENELNKIFEEKDIKKSLEEIQKIHGLLLEGKEDSKNDWMIPIEAQVIEGSQVLYVENQYHLGAMNNPEILEKLIEFSRA
jgi:hypothetical protein